MNKQILFIFVLALLTIISCQREELTQPTTEDSPTTEIRNDGELTTRAAGENFEPNELLVKFKPSVSTSRRDQVLSSLGASVKEKILTKAMQSSGDNDGVYLLRVAMAALDAVSRARGLGEVLYAEPNYLYQHNATSNDTYFTNGSLWGMYGATTSPANQYGSRAANAWAAGNTGSSAVYIGIIDEGYMYTHEDLAANAGTTGETVNGIDDNGNGLIDDIYGWDFDGNNNSVFDGSQDDHGTHVAGTIGGVGGNGKGVAGVCWNVKLLSAKFLGRRGGTTANAIKAVDYFTDLKNGGMNIVATNNSWGGGGFSQALQDAIDRANTAGVLFIAAAGNASSNNDAVVNYPSNYPNSNIIAVASITNAGGLSSFSNYGATQVDLGAPGSGIWSTVPSKNGTSAYASYNGTSMATPHVTGAAALYAASHSGATAATIKSAIISSVILTPSLSGKCGTGGRLNASGF